jgi:serine O-acetyltransferase
MTVGVRSVIRRVREDLDVVVGRDPAVSGRMEALLSPQLPALWLHRAAHRRYRRDHRVLARLLSTSGRLLSGGVDIHPGARIGRRLFIDHGAAVVIGETAVIGDDVTIYHQVTLGAVGWWRDVHRAPGERRHPRIGDRVVIGANASVLGPVTVGDDAIVGAHALVVEDVPPGARVHGPCALVSSPATARRPVAVAGAGGGARERSS